MMFNAFRSEWLKLRTTRAPKVILACAVFLPMLIQALTAKFAYKGGEVSSPVISNLAGSAPLVSLLIGVVGVLCSTQEYSQGTIRITLVAIPQRTKVLFAKVITMLVVSSLSVATYLGGSLGLSHIIMSSRDLKFELIGSDSRVIVSYFMVVALVSILGLSLGFLFKSPPGAISALLLWPTIIEGMLFGLASLATHKNYFRWAPMQSGFQLVNAVIDDNFNSWGVSTLYFTTFVSVFVVLASVMFVRRDA
jgi:ABC-2 type transport system permease protein